MSIPVTDPNIFWPGGPSGGATGNGLCWSIAGDGSSATCSGPTYFRFALSMPASGSATLNYTTPQTSALAPPTVRVTITQYQVTLSSGSTYYPPAQLLNICGTPTTTAISSTTSLSLITGASAGTYIFEIELIAGSYANWLLANTSQAWNVTSITAAGSSTVAIPTGWNKTGLMMIYGASKAAGGNLPATNQGDFSVTVARQLGEAFDCEIASATIGGTGYVVGSGSGASITPGLYSTLANGGGLSTSASFWNYIWGGQARVFPSNLTYVVILTDGENDLSWSGLTTSITTNAVQNLLPLIRAAVPAKCKIIVNPSWSDGNGTIVNGGPVSWAQQDAAILAGWQAYQAATPDPLCYYVPVNFDLRGFTLSHWQGYPSGGPFLWLTNQEHPNQTGNQFTGARLVRKIDQSLGCITQSAGSMPLVRAC